MREIKRRKIKKIPLADKKMVEDYTGMSQSTLRNWRSRGEHSELFFKIRGKVFLYANAWDRFERKAVRDSIKKVEESRK